jgi:uncharacterized protein (TIGR02145 family)
VAGGKMKTTGTIQAGTGLWTSPNTGATNESGFSAIPAGFRRLNGTFDDIGKYGYWWSSSETNTYGAWRRDMIYMYGDVARSNFIKSDGYSVRCLRNS